MGRPSAFPRSAPPRPETRNLSSANTPANRSGIYAGASILPLRGQTDVTVPNAVSETRYTRAKPPNTENELHPRRKLSPRLERAATYPTAAANASSAIPTNTMATSRTPPVVGRNIAHLDMSPRIESSASARV